MTRVFFVGLACVCVLVSGSQFSHPASKAAIEGELIIESGKPAVLRSQGKDIPLSGADDPLSETLRDKRISGKHVRLQGAFRGDGSFEVSELFVVHPDGLYRIVYYCNVCNITAFSPGNCVCCQRPTQPLEIPLTDPRVNHESVKGPAK